MNYGNYGNYVNRTTIELDKETRDELRRYKAQDGLTYDEAIEELLREAGWLTDAQ